MRLAFASLIAVAVPGAALADGERARDAAVPLLPVHGFALPQAEDDAERWMLPDVADSYERREPPRLRWRGKKVKLRVPIG